LIVITFKKLKRKRKMTELISMKEKLPEFGKKRKITEWISVKDQLPGLGEKVDAWIGKRMVNVWLDHYSPIDERLFWYTGKSNLFHVDSIEFCGDEYWMPLPKPPEEEIISDRNKEILAAIKAVRAADCGAWMKDCSGLFHCSEGREKRQELSRLLDQLYKAAGV